MSEKNVPFHMAKEDLHHFSTSSFVEFCMTPGRRWDERAREPLAIDVSEFIYDMVRVCGEEA